MWRFEVGMTYEQVLAIIYSECSPWVSVPSESDTRFSVVHLYRNVALTLVFNDGMLAEIHR